MKGEGGFTLVELLVSLLIFGMLSAAGVALLSFSVKAQDAADTRLAELAELRRAGALMTADFGQAAPRLSRDEAGAVHSAFAGGTGQEGGVAIALVRRGWENYDGAARSSLQKVEYRLAGDRLERIAYRHVDGAAPLPAVTMIDGVTGLRLRYRDNEGQWRERWDPGDLSALPRAVEVQLTTRANGQVRQLFLVSADA